MNFFSVRVGMVLPLRKSKTLNYFDKETYVSLHFIPGLRESFLVCAVVFLESTCSQILCNVMCYLIPVGEAHNSYGNLQYKDATEDYEILQKNNKKVRHSLFYRCLVNKRLNELAIVGLHRILKGLRFDVRSGCVTRAWGHLLPNLFLPHPPIAPLNHDKCVKMRPNLTISA